ncbi:MAG: DsbA family protein [Aestuariivirga sp.]|nr:DsbA family protein [Aestuariivirga sp.]
MHTGLRTLLLSILLLWGVGSPVSAAEFSDSQRMEMEAIIKDYLLANPDLLREMGQLLEAKERLAEDQQRKGALVSNADQLFRNGTDFVVGNPNGNVTMVEFFDYNCGWCKKGFPEVLSLIEEDKDLKFVMKEFPIFGGDSDYAAQAAVAASKQGKYWALHVAMMSHEGKITKEAVDELAAAQGLDMAQLKKDMESPETAGVLERNRALAQSLAINGTPAFIIDDKLVPGYLPKAELASAVNDVRAKGGCSLC